MRSFYRRIIFIVLFIFFNSFICFANFNNCSNDTLKRLCCAPSYIPQNEAYIHIGGGLFSHFEGKAGKLLCPRYNFSRFDLDENILVRDKIPCYGQFTLNLMEMQKSSSFCYELNGKICMITPCDKQILKMEKLDYVFNEELQQLYYRIKCTQDDGRELNINSAYIFGTICNKNCPLLIGYIAFLSENNIVKQSYAYYIKGRDSFSAECHLKNMDRITSLNMN